MQDDGRGLQWRVANAQFGLSFNEEGKNEGSFHQLVPQLLNPKLGFVTGEIDGYTDNVGKPEYNLALSKKRADAVATYLKSKGVQFGRRFVTQGLAETKPIADNKTEEGRAQNRRASIRRTDCGAP